MMIVLRAEDFQQLEDALCYFKSIFSVAATMNYLFPQ